MLVVRVIVGKVVKFNDPGLHRCEYIRLEGDRDGVSGPSIAITSEQIELSDVIFDVAFEVVGLD